MGKLVQVNDKKVMSNSNFVKNAVFYKDMFAFYDAYNFIVNQKQESLPNYCFYPNGKMCLEGICLLIRNYASEFGFESVKLTLDYLKVLYYTIASYSQDENLPSKTLLNIEFEQYKTASANQENAFRKDYDKANEKYLQAKADYDKFNSKKANNIVTSKILNAVSIIILIAGIMLASIPLTVYFWGNLKLTQAILYAGISVVFGIICFVIMKVASNKLETSSNESAYILQNKKKIKDECEKEKLAIQDKFNRVAGEKYEYNNSFGNLLRKYSEQVSLEEVLRKASEYRLLSYNLVHDIKAIFVNQQRDVKEIMELLDRVNSENYKKQFSDIYSEIKEKDWLYFDNEVRLAFLKRFVDISEKTFDWKVESHEELVNPFGIDIKNLSKEKIVYLKDRNGLFISSSLDKFMGTKYIKNLKELDMVDVNNLSKIRNLKMEFSSHFFDYEQTKPFNNLFYSEKIEDDVKISDEILQRTSKIPTYVLVKLKLIENKLGLSNSDNSVIAQISEYLSKHEANEFNLVNDPTRKSYTELAVTKETITVEDIDDYSVKYDVDGNSFVGYKLATV